MFHNLRCVSYPKRSVCRAESVNLRPACITEGRDKRENDNAKVPSARHLSALLGIHLRRSSKRIEVEAQKYHARSVNSVRDVSSRPTREELPEAGIGGLYCA